MGILKNIDIQSNWFLFILFFAAIFSTAFGFADVYDHMSNVDVQTYVGLSEFDFDQHPVRRYRIIIPFLAAGLHFIFGPIFTLLSPNDFPGDFSRIMSFVVVNSLLMSVYAVLLFRICQAVIGSSKIWPAIIGVFSVLTCRWTLVISGSALVDSLYLIVLGLLLLGILKNKLWMLILAVYLGPWAKEAFIFFIPLLLFLEKKYYPKILLHLVISGVAIFTFRYFFDQSIGAEFGESFTRDVSHFSVIPDSLRRLFSFHGAYEVLSIGGVWNVFILVGVFLKKYRIELYKSLSKLWLLLAVLVLIQALLSFELARMLYLLTPLLAVVIAQLFDLFSQQSALQMKES
ncbi:MAG: hypothetical protein P1U56_20715 [Saprospiraceae bacterium]|nr:hypothetical protein [Saprospiraceae bacterium]